MMLVRVCICLLNPSFLSINLSLGIKINKSKILAGPILSVFGLSIISSFPEDEVVWLFLEEYSGMIFSPPVISRFLAQPPPPKCLDYRQRLHLTSPRTDEVLDGTNRGIFIMTLYAGTVQTGPGAIGLDLKSIVGQMGLDT